MKKEKYYNLGLTLLILLFNFLLFMLFNNSYSQYLNDSLSNNKTIEQVIIIILIVSPLFIIGVKYAYSSILVNTFNIKKVSKGSLFKLSLLSYIPLLLGTLVNTFLSLVWGVNEKTYLNLSNVINSDYHIINVLSMKINPFEILSIFLYSYLFTKVINGTKKDFIIVIITWYIIDILILFFFSNTNGV